MSARPPYRELLAAIADAVQDTGLRVGDLPSHLHCWISDDDGDDLGPDGIVRLTTGEYVRWWGNHRVELRGAIRVAGYARGES